MMQVQRGKNPNSTLSKHLMQHRHTHTQYEGHHVVRDLSHPHYEKEHCEHLPAGREDLQEAEASLHGHRWEKDILPAKPFAKDKDCYWNGMYLWSRAMKESPREHKYPTSSDAA